MKGFFWNFFAGRLALALLLGLALYVLFSGPAMAQVSGFRVEAKKLGAGSYALSASGRVAAGWSVYGSSDAAEGIGALTLTSEEKGIVIGAASPLVQLSDYRDPLFSDKGFKVYRDSFAFSVRVDSVPAGLSSLPVMLSGYGRRGEEFVPLSESVEVSLEGNAVAGVGRGGFVMKLAGVDLSAPASSCGGEDAGPKSLVWIFVLGLGGGLLALLTPCVFPMVPLTVSWFTSASASAAMARRNGLLYGLFIFLIYLFGSVPFHILGNISPEIFNVFSTNAWVNLLFFVVFIVFALSFFGLFEITLPSWVANRADSRGGLGSLGGIFFMALTLALVSFSCTGPILGSLLVGSVSSASGAWALTVGMGGFGLALALPFGLFAMFPHWMKRLPRSGGWLETVKKSLAFIELALALKFLSNADLVAHWGLLRREVFLGVWIVIALLLSLYLFGVLRLGGKRPLRISRGRMVFGGLALAFAAYLLPGLTGSRFARLQLLSGFPPPLSYSIYGEKGGHGGMLKADVLNDFDRAVALSRRSGKPILIDFTGWACVNCRKMEENVWSRPEVASYIREHFVLVSLYVDDRAMLPAQERFEYLLSSGKKKRIATVGDKWATFQAANFSQVTQPLYVALSPEGKLLSVPVGYTPDAGEYLSWLECSALANVK